MASTIFVDPDDEDPQHTIPHNWPAMIRWDEREWWRCTSRKTAATRPIARIHLSSRQDRIECERLRSAWTLFVWTTRVGPIASFYPCTWCGQPTPRLCKRGCLRKRTPSLRHAWLSLYGQSSVCAKCFGQFRGWCMTCYDDQFEKSLWETDSGTS